MAATQRTVREHPCALSFKEASVPEILVDVAHAIRIRLTSAKFALLVTTAPISALAIAALPIRITKGKVAERKAVVKGRTNGDYPEWSLVPNILNRAAAHSFPMLILHLIHLQLLPLLILLQPLIMILRLAIR